MDKSTSCSRDLHEQKERLCWSALFLLEIIHSGHPFTVKAWEQEWVMAREEWRGGGEAPLDAEWWKKGERVGKRRATAPSLSWSWSWSCMRCLLLVWLLLQPRSCLLCTRLISQCPSVTAKPLWPCIGGCLCPWAVPITLATAGRAPSPLPSVLSGQRSNLQSWGCDCCEGCCCTSAGWMSLKVREGEENPKNNFWKNLYQTIPVVGAAFSEMQMHFPFISAMVLSCFINNRLVWKTDKMGTSTVITLLFLWGLPWKQCCVLIFSKDKQGNKFLTPCPPLQLDTVPDWQESIKSENVTHKNIISKLHTKESISTCLIKEWEKVYFLAVVVEVFCFFFFKSHTIIAQTINKRRMFLFPGVS